VLDAVFPDVPLLPGLSLECLANRDSLSYGKIYKLDPVTRLEAMFRGTLRSALPLVADYLPLIIHPI
jgi:alpha-aminoadipic semialdehyde synthase